MKSGRRASLVLIASLIVFDAHAAQGYVHDAAGDVKAQVGMAAAVAVGKNQTFESGTTISTGPKSHAVLKFEDGQVVLLKENTTFQVKQYAYDAKVPEQGSIVLSLVRGGLRAITGLLVNRKRDAFKLETPTATIGIRGTDFAVETVNPLFGQVFAGSIVGANGAGTFEVGAGQFFSVPNFNTLGALIPGAQVPPGVLQFPNVPLPPPTPGLPSGLSPLGGGALGVPGAAIGLGAAIAAGIAAAGGGGGGGGGVIVPTPSHH